MVSGRYLLVITNRRDDPTRRISTMTRTIAAVALAASALVGMTGLSQAQGLRAPQVRFITSPSAPIYGDADGANAKNPALPAYARGRGQETGGPARELIGR
jgi:hypothetical protein